MFVFGLVISSYLFSRGIVLVGLFFILVMIVGLLINPPGKCIQTYIDNV